MIVCDTIASVSYFWFLGYKACGLLVPQPGIEPTFSALGGEVLTTGQPGKSPIPHFKGEKTEEVKAEWTFPTSTSNKVMELGFLPPNSRLHLTAFLSGSPLTSPCSNKKAKVEINLFSAGEFADGMWKMS